MLKKIFPLFFIFILLNNFAFAQCKITEKLVNTGFKKSAAKRKIDVVVVHSTFHANSPDSFSVDGVLKQFKTYGVSAHYLIGRDGMIYNLVKENDVSYHAGVSSLPDGRKNINSTSIGIEVMTSYKNSPTEEQYQALLCLIKEIKDRHKINYLVRHSDIAPVRKTDPWNFDWNRMKEVMP